MPGQTIGHGSFIGTKVITVNAPKRSVTDSVTQTQLKKWISSKVIVKNTANTLYFIYLDPGIVLISEGVVRAKATAAIITMSVRSTTQ